MPADPEHDGSVRERERQSLRRMARELEAATENLPDDITDGGENASQGTSSKNDDNESILSWDKASDAVEVPSTSVPLPVRPLGLSRRAGYTQFNDYDVVTVHGAIDNHQTAWTSREDNSNWIEDKLFRGLSVRQLDYAYDTSDSARIHDPSANGITIEANALLDSLVENRVELPSTEYERPIIWICHDLGGSIVKEALFTAMYKQPGPGSEDDPEYSMEICKMYRRLPLLTSTIIFLGCPHGNESREGLEDQLFALMSLPDPPLRTKVLTKIGNLARQIERINLEFHDTKVLDRAVILNITTVPEKQTQADEVNETQTEPKSVEQKQAEKHSSDLPTSPASLFSQCHGGIYPSLGIFYTALLYSADHAGLVRGPDPSSGGDLFDWTTVFSELFNERLGYNIYNHYAFLGEQNSLLSLSPPTRPMQYRFYTDGASRPDLISWIIDHDVFANKVHFRSGPETVYLHAGDQHPTINMKAISQELYVAYDLVKRIETPRDPYFGCFYFEFDQHDSRRGGIQAMIVSFIRTYACRFWSDGDKGTEFSVAYLNKFKCWSLKDLITLFLRIQRSEAMKDMVIILGQFDQCDVAERSIFLEAVLKRQKWSDLFFTLIITTTRPEPFIYEVLPPESAISLEDCPLALGEYLVYPITPDERQRHLQSLIDRLSTEEKHLVEHTYKWIKYAAEPLTLKALAEAIRCSLPSEMAELRYIQSPEEFGRFVIKTLEGIVLLDGRDVRFSDDAFYEVPETSQLNGTQDQADRSHAGIATVCLSYLLGDEGQKMLHSLSVESHGLCEDDLNWSPLMLPRDSLVSYALRFWTTHYQAAGDYRPTDLANELLGDRRKRGAWTEAVYVTSNPFTRIQKEYISPLPYMAMFGLDDLIRRQIQDDERQDGWSQDQWLAIVEAARNGHEKTVALLFEHAHTDVDGLGEALHWAANFGEGGALDFLVSKALGIQEFQWPPYILNRAVAAGLETLVSALVHAGYNLNEEDSDGKRHAVHTAVEFGQDRVLKILLDSKRVDLTLENDDDKSPLMLGAEAGNPESIRHLLGAGASLNDCKGPLLRHAIAYASHEVLSVLMDALAPTDSGIVNMIHDGDNTLVPVIETASKGYERCTRVLLDRGADPNVINANGSALYQVIDKDRSRCIGRLLLEKGADPNGSTTNNPVDDGRETAMMRAIETGNELLVEMLLDHGANIDVIDPTRSWRGTPLTWAIRCGHVHIAKLLLGRGADVNLVSEEEPDSWSPLFSAAFERSSDMIEPLIKHGANVQWTRGTDQWSILHAAYDSANTLATLIQNGVVDINVTDRFNFTTLMHAARYNDKDSIEVLLRQKSPKADLEIMSIEEPTSTALHLACTHGCGDAVKLLLEAGADVNRQRSDGRFPLVLLLADTLTGNYTLEHLVELMLKQKPNLGLSDNDDNTVLHRIRGDTPLSVVMRLVEEGAPVNGFNYRRFTPLSWAVHIGNNAVARYLTTVRGSQNNVIQPEYGSILRMAVTDCSVEVVRVLVRFGIEHSIPDPESDKYILHSAIERFQKKERREIIRYLVEELGVDVNFTDNRAAHRSPLMKVVRELPDRSLLKYLLKHGANTNFVDIVGKTAVHWAAIHENIDAVKILFKFGADLSIGDKYGRTPLHFAAGKGSTEIVQFILEKHPPSLEVADLDGWTPLMWACRAQMNFAAKMLVETYKANSRVRSKDGEWSPLKIARVKNWPDAWLLSLVPDLDVHLDDESQDSRDYHTPPGKDHWPWECVGCLMPIFGQASVCTICEVKLCYKCDRHREKMHDPQHTFVDLDEWDREQAAKVAEVYQSEHGQESGNGSGSEEEQDEDESESEEEEDDESE